MLNCKKRKIGLVALIAVMTICVSLSSFVDSSFAAETTLIANLNKKIKSDFKEMQQVQREAEGKIKTLNAEIESVVGKIENTEDEAGREALTNKYFEIRAKQLYWEAWKMKEVENRVVRIVNNLSELQREMGRFGQTENGKSLVPSDSKEVSQTLKGLASIVTPMYALKKDDPRMQGLVRNIQVLNARYEAVFKNRALPNVQEQIEYMEDLHAFIRSVMTTLDMERVYLTNTVFVLMSDGVVKVVNEIQNDLMNKGNLMSVTSDKHQLDERVLGRRPKQGSFYGEAEFNPDAIGNY